MSVEQQRSVLDEHRIRIILKLGKADHFTAGIGERLLIGGVLRDRVGDVDRRAIEVRQCAVRQLRTDRSRERLHQPPCLRIQSANKSGQREPDISFDRCSPKPWPPSAKKWASTGAPALRQACVQSRLFSGRMKPSSIAAATKLGGVSFVT